MRRIAAIVALAGLAAWPGAPAADETTASGLIQSTEVDVRRQGIEVTQTVRRVDGQLPPPLNRLELSLPPGTQLNSARFPRCRLALLQANGPSACVRRARVGSGTVRAQAPFRFPHEFAGTLTIFNGPKRERSSRRSVLMYVRSQAGPTFVIVGNWAGSRRSGLRLDFHFPLTIPEVVPDSLVQLSFSLGGRRGGTTFLRAPCPGTYQATAGYVDGTVVTSSERAECR